MSKRKTSIIAAGLLASTLFAASPAVFAGNHSDHRGDGPRDKTEMCENMREGKGPFDKAEREKKMAEREKKMAEREEAMAKRLELNDDQRKIWNEIHEERHQKHEKRMKKMMEKMEKRCDMAPE
ncbi:hypothetical protein [Marinobacter sp. ANT_B65]|uniref:hypothetical protein n=1 Tax=Marinobacter sp. ANT_B65 TaxID=2039467 RepID=UPI000BBE6E97|nr:hypothetical protein [Marinobacter sp. ANT_B65]PCM45076.1 hypothetical protein CPA50_03410 [Marinobacter sp. ANT_B65]